MDDEPDRPVAAPGVEFVMLMTLIGVPFAYAVLRGLFALSTIALAGL
jgi:hypothetical protein